MSVVLPNDPVQITFNGEEAREFILEPQFGKPAITAFHSIEQDIKAKKQIAYLSQYGLTGLVDSGCGDPVNQATSTGSEKFWDPVDILFEATQCESDIKNSLFRWATANGINRSDLTQNAVYSQFNTEVTIEASIEGLFRRLWFNDTTIAAADLTGGAGQVPYFNGYDGFWKQIFDSVTAGGADEAVRAYTIAENAEASTALQLDLAATTAKDAFNAMWSAADTRLMEQNDLVIIATKTLYDNYATFLESQGADPSFERIEGGFRSLSYRGIPIFSANFWDRNIRRYFDNGVTLDTPHRAVLTTKENLRVGLDAESSPTQMEFFFDRYTRNNVSRVQTTEDAKLIFNYFISAAY